MKKYLRAFRELLHKDRQVNKPKVTEYPGSMPGVLNALIAYNQYGAYCVPAGSRQRVAAQKILKGEVYEPETVKFVQENCGEGDVVHAGTYFGDLLPSFSQAVSPSAKVWAFEPVEENYRCANITALLNSLKNVELRHAGLGEQESVAEMKVEDESGTNLGGSSSIVKKHEEDGVYQEVNIVSIDEVVPEDRNVSIIQLDVEGYERPALAGALQTIERCKPIILLEDNKEAVKSEWFKEEILGRGYKEDGKVHFNTIFRPQ